jgi:hypothetical protein
VASNLGFAVDVFKSRFSNVTTVEGIVESFDIGPVGVGMEKIFLDNYLLSEADDLIITPQSTFGAVAAFRSGLVPMYVWSASCLPSKIEAGPGGRWPNMILW